MRNETVYSSGINIWDQSDLSTLSVFFDKVLLPASDDDGDLVEFSRPLGSNERFKLSSIALWNLEFTTRDGQRHLSQDYPRDWEDQNSVLFDEGVIERLPPTAEKNALLEAFNGGGVEDLLLDLPFSIRSTLQSASNPSEPTRETIYLWQDHFIHLLRKDIDVGQVFITKEEHHNRDILKSLLAKTTLSCLLPKLKNLEADHILEVRRRVSDTREGFSLHMQALSSDLDSLNREGAGLEEIETRVLEIVETQIVPDYYEFQRQLRSERFGMAGRALDFAERIFAIDVAPWTPKFYGEIAKALGSAIFNEIGRNDRFSNEGQAYKFIRTLGKHRLLSDT